MTETSPMGTISRLKREMLDWPEERRLDFRVKQGIPMPGVEVRIVGDQNEDLPWDGEHVGELLVRGPWVASSYYNNPEAGAAFTADGWFRTGDMASLDRYGYVQLSDRKKDLIKRKGEWISSVDMENDVLGHPGVLEAAVVARPDPVCDELPAVLIVSRNDPSHPVEPQAIVDLLARKFAKWQLPLPEDIHFIDALPKTGVGKVDKKALRKLVTERSPCPGA
jgi:fatty-acyl-CoA synthase